MALSEGIKVCSDIGGPNGKDSKSVLDFLILPCAGMYIWSVSSDLYSVGSLSDVGGGIVFLIYKYHGSVPKSLMVAIRPFPIEQRTKSRLGLAVRAVRLKDERRWGSVSRSGL